MVASDAPIAKPSTVVIWMSTETAYLHIPPSGCYGTDVARMLSDAGDHVGGLPPLIQCDNGTEFTLAAGADLPLGDRPPWSVDRRPSDAE